MDDSLRTQLEQDYVQGTWLALENGSVIAQGETRSDVLKKATNAFKEQERTPQQLYVFCVGVPQETVEVTGFDIVH